MGFLALSVSLCFIPLAQATPGSAWVAAVAAAPSWVFIFFNTEAQRHRGVWRKARQRKHKLQKHGEVFLRGEI
jgi:hypothetical protein